MKDDGWWSTVTFVRIYTLIIWFNGCTLSESDCAFFILLFHSFLVLMFLHDNISSDGHHYILILFIAQNWTGENSAAPINPIKPTSE